MYIFGLYLLLTLSLARACVCGCMLVRTLVCLIQLYRFIYVQGFDVGEVPDKVLEPGLIRPILFKSPRGVKEFNDLSKLAIEHYNKQNVCVHALLVH